MSRVVRVTATDGAGRDLYDSTITIDGVTDEQAPGEAIEFAIRQMRDWGMNRVQHYVAVWTVRQCWVGVQDDKNSEDTPMTKRYSIEPQKLGQVLAKAHVPMAVQDTLLTWCAVHGTLQMALRHPEFPDSTRVLLEAFIEQLGKGLVEAGFLTAETLQEAIALERRYHAERPNE